MQKEGVYYTEIFSPVMKYTIIRCLLVLVAQFKWEFDQLDDNTSFLYGELNEIINMKQYVSFINGDLENTVLSVKKFLVLSKTST